MLRCTKCKETKDVDAFSLNCRSKSGRHSYCRECHAAYAAQKRANRANATPNVALSAMSAGAMSVGAIPSAPEEMAEATEADQLYMLRYPWENSPIKIGHAKDITTRVHSLESGHNFRLQVLTIFPGQGRLERKVHALLSEHRAANGRGHEWFNVTLQQALTAVALAIANCVHSGPIADLA